MQISFFKKIVPATMFTLLIQSFAYAGAGGSGVGNGGVGFTCPNQPGVARLFDLYEGEALKNLKPIVSQLNFKDQALAYQKQLNDATAFLDYEGVFGKRVEQVISSLKFIGADSSLVLTGDLNNFIYPTGCTLVQILNYHNDGFIYVDGHYWNQLSETDKTAAILHEAVYSYLRDSSNVDYFVNGDVDSTRTRRVVYTIMAGIKLRKVSDYDLQPSGSEQYYCYTPDARAGQRRTTEFAMFVSPDGKKTQVYFQGLAGRVLLTRAKVEIDGSIHDRGIMTTVDSLVDWDVHVILSALRDQNNGMTNIIINAGGQRTSEPVKCARLIDRP